MEEAQDEAEEAGLLNNLSADLSEMGETYHDEFDKEPWSLVQQSIDFEQLAKELDAHAWGDHGPKCELIHYTSASGALGILGQGKIRGGHASFMNDASELKYGEERIAAHFKDRLDRESGRFAEELTSQSPERFGLTKHCDIYLTSFTEPPERLGAWLAYGSRGDGYALQVDPNLEHGNWLKVVYERTAQIKILDSIWDLVFAEAVRLDLPGQMDARGQLIVLFQLALAKCVVRFKDPEFKDEREWRMFSIRLRNRQGEPGEDEPKFRATASMMIPYVEHPMPGLRKVVLGPNVSQQACAQAGVELFLQSKGYSNVPVNPSSIPYRSTG